MLAIREITSTSGCLCAICFIVSAFCDDADEGDNGDNGYMKMMMRIEDVDDDEGFALRGITSIRGESCALRLIVSAFYAHLEALHFFSQTKRGKQTICGMPERLMRREG